MWFTSVHRMWFTIKLSGNMIAEFFLKIETTKTPGLRNRLFANKS